MKSRIITLLVAFLAIAGNAVWGQGTSLTGEGTPENPYQISNADDLKAFRELVNGGDADACAKLMTDIDLNNEEWDPIMYINTSTYDMGYTGTFNGNNKTIKGLSIKTANDSAPFYGLFGIIGMINMAGTISSTDGIVKNLTIEGEIEISADIASAAGICFRNHGTIENCINKASVTSKSTRTEQFTYSGGICYQNYGTIRGCANLGAVSAQTAAAGISASNAGTIEKCYNEGTITSNVYAGGICIANRGGTSNVTNCYNIGTIKAEGTGSNSGAAGICFYTRNLSPFVTTITISNCHNYGSIEGRHCAGIFAIEAYDNDKEDIISVTNNYYKSTDNLSGYLIYTNSTEETKDQQGVCEPKSAEAFAGGEVLYLLQQKNPGVWVQTIGTDNYPKFETEGQGSTVYQVTVQPNDATMGTTTGGGVYVANAEATVTATPHEGYEFINWTIEGEEKSTEATYIFNVTESVTLIANFQKIDEGGEEEPGDQGDIHKPQRPIKYYNIYVDTICPGLNVEVSKDVVQEGHQVSAYLTIQAECDTTGMRFEYKRGLFGYWKDLKELEGVQPGEYIIKNIYTDIYIRALDATLPEEEPTGIEDVESIKAYAKEGSIYVYTPNREEVTIISMSGAIIKHAEQVGLQSYNVSRGIYIVRIGEKVFKLKN